MKITACPICEKEYKRKRRLLVHFELTHLKIPSSFVCTFPGCEKRFSEKGNLKVHLRIHTGELPFPCSFCEKRFSSIGNKRDHERRHFDERPYNCGTCYKGFYRKYLLNKHILKSHSKIANIESFNDQCIPLVSKDALNLKNNCNQELFPENI